MTPRFDATIPVLRMFDVAKAREFYVDFLGMSWDWEHRFEPDAPLFAQVSRGALLLFLSEHFGDGTPGAITTRIHDLYWRMHEDDAHNTPIAY